MLLRLNLFGGLKVCLLIFTPNSHILTSNVCTEQKSLDPTSADYGSIPLVVNTAGEPVIRLHHKNAKYLAAYAAANPKGKDHAMTSVSPTRPQEFEGHLIANDDNDGLLVEDHHTRLYQIPQSPERAASANLDYVDFDDIEEFTEPEITNTVTRGPINAFSDTEDVTMASPGALPPSRGTRYPAQQAYDDVSSTLPVAKAHVQSPPHFALPLPVVQPHGDITPTRPLDGLQRAEQLRRQPRRIATPVNPDVFYRKNKQMRGAVSKVS